MIRVEADFDDPRPANADGNPLPELPLHAALLATDAPDQQARRTISTLSCDIA